MRRPPSTELRARRSGCQATMPSASPRSIAESISLKIGRPGSFRLRYAPVRSRRGFPCGVSHDFHIVGRLYPDRPERGGDFRKGSKPRHGTDGRIILEQPLRQVIPPLLVLEHEEHAKRKILVLLGAVPTPQWERFGVSLCGKFPQSC